MRHLALLLAGLSLAGCAHTADPVAPATAVTEDSEAVRQSLVQQADVLSRGPHSAEALPLYRRAWELGERGTTPLYVAACVAATAGQRAEALEWVGRLAEVGYDNPAELTQDPDLASLREDPAFLQSTQRMAATRERNSEYIKTHAQEFKGLDVPSALLGAIDNHRLVLIGESHGIEELPEYVFQITQAVAAKREVALGLEFPRDIQESVQAFLKTGDEKLLASTAFFQDANYHSGRGSASMVRLLTNLRRLPNVQVFCFDEPRSGERVTERDTKMARNILDFTTAHPERTVLVFTGNIHSRLTVGTPWDPKARNMGAEILRLSQGALTLQNTTNLQFIYDEGTAWQCWGSAPGAPMDCGGKKVGPVNSLYRTAVPFMRYFLAEPKMTNGHLHSVFIQRVSASMPWTPGH
ncbi:hypothetical protein JGU66_03445 [Myxococcaceae bacterium JPH2]|nr:hypothetical protein [Myxococcaceae bacterium JPH2]